MARSQRLLNRYAVEEDVYGIAFISYGKDSLAMLEAIKILNLPLHRIIHTEVWATQDIPANLPPMVEFKKKADEIIFKRYGIRVEHVCATKNGGGVYSYEDMFYERMSSGQFEGTYRGFPLTKAGWCGKLKTDKVNIRRYILSAIEGGDIRLPDSKGELVLNTQESKITGFATRWSQYCTGELKRFLHAPARRAVQKSCATSALLRMNLYV